MRVQGDFLHTFILAPQNEVCLGMFANLRALGRASLYFAEKGLMEYPGVRCFFFRILPGCVDSSAFSSCFRFLEFFSSAAVLVSLSWARVRYVVTAAAIRRE